MKTAGGRAEAEGHAGIVKHSDMRHESCKAAAVRVQRNLQVALAKV